MSLTIAIVLLLTLAGSVCARVFRRLNVASKSPPPTPPGPVHRQGSREPLTAELPDHVEDPGFIGRTSNLAAKI